MTSEVLQGPRAGTSAGSFGRFGDPAACTNSGGQHPDTERCGGAGARSGAVAAV